MRFTFYTFLKILFFVFIVIATVFTTFALFGSEWRYFNYDHRYGDGILWSHHGTGRLLSFWIVLAFVIIALIIELIALIFTAYTFTKSTGPVFTFSLASMALVPAFLLLVAVCIYGYNSGETVVRDYLGPVKIMHVSLGFSYWMAISALVILTMATIMAFIGSYRISGQYTT